MKSTGIFSWIRLPKWVVFMFSLVMAFFCAFLFVVGPCSEFQPICVESYLYISEAFFWAPILLLFSLITAPLNKIVFNSWVRFSIPWIFFSTVLVFLIPIADRFAEPNWKAITSLSLAAIFFAVSILIVLVKSVQVYWFKK